jgi:acetyl-CoA acetyltransferase
MSKQIQDAYIVAATRTPIGKAPRGMFNKTRPDDLLVRVMQSALAQAPGLDPALITDAIIGCSFPEAEQGFNIASIGAAGRLATHRRRRHRQPLLRIGHRPWPWRLTASAWAKPT